MLITFLVRSKMSDRAYVRMYTDIDGAFTLAELLDSEGRIIEYKMLYDEIILDTVPGTSYKPTKTVRYFDYKKE